MEALLSTGGLNGCVNPFLIDGKAVIWTSVEGDDGTPIPFPLQISQNEYDRIISVRGDNSW